jgi:hypothetical protein
MPKLIRRYTVDAQGNTQDNRLYLGVKEMPYGDKFVQIIREAVDNFQGVLNSAEKEARAKGRPLKVRLEFKIEQPEERATQ